MASKEKTVDAKALMASIAKGWKLVDTPKVRAGLQEGPACARSSGTGWCTPVRSECSSARGL